MTDRQRRLALAALLVVVAGATAATAIAILYDAGFEQQRDRLVVSARSQARLIEAIADYAAAHTSDPTAATLSQVVAAHERYRGFGRTGEFMIGHLEGGQMHYLLAHRGQQAASAPSVPLDAPIGEVDRRFRAATAAQTDWSFECRIRRVDGEVRWIWAAGGHQRDAAGQARRMAGIVQDITERKRVEEALRTNRAHLATLSRQLITAQETERRRLARELHDEIGQVLTAVHISLQQVRNGCDPAALPRLDESARIVSQAIAQVRDLSLNLRPAMLDDFGLVPALRWYLERQKRQTGCVIDFEVRSAGAALSSELSSACYRIVQEAMTNVQRHAKARNVRVELEHTESEVRLAVHDDGVGFDANLVQRQAAAGRSFGVLGMQERAELLGGRFELHSTAGQGCEVRVWLPIPKGEDESGQAIEPRAEPSGRGEQT